MKKKAGKLDHFRGELRGAKLRGASAVARMLLKQGEEVSPRTIRDLHAAASSVAPLEVARLSVSAKRSEAELFAVAPIGFPTLEAQLVWSACALERHTAAIRMYLPLKRRLEDALLDGNQQIVEQTLRSIQELTGASAFVVEQRIAALQMFEGIQAQKKYLSDLESALPRRLITLLATFASDRCEDQSTFEGVHRRLKDWIARARLPQEYEAFLQFHVTGLTPGANAWRDILALEGTAGVVDLYEATVSALFDAGIGSDNAARSISQLVCDMLSGVGDIRLFALNSIHLRRGQHASVQPFNDGRSRDIDTVRTLALNDETSMLPRGSLSSRVVEDLRLVFTELNKSDSAIDRLFKCSANHRALFFGRPLMSLVVSNILPTKEPLAIPSDFALGLSGAKEIALFGVPRDFRDASRAYYATVGLEPLDVALHRPLVLLDAALSAIEQGLTDEALRLCNEIQQNGIIWYPHAQKTRFRAFAASNQTDRALLLAAKWLGESRDIKSALQINLAELLSNKKWQELKRVDPVVLALCLFGIGMPSEADSYNLMRALRAIVDAGIREKLDGAAALSPEEIFVFKEIWRAPHLDLIQSIDSSTKLAQERMGVCRQLVTKDPSRADEYVEEIRDITFDMALDAGVQQIDKSRLYVDSEGIAKWADKELKEEFNRYIELAAVQQHPIDSEARRSWLEKIHNNEIPQELFDIPTSDADLLLMDLIVRLKERYLRDPKYGLDSFLSLRVRHGSLTGTLRGPFDEEGLLFIRDIGTKTFAPGERWGEQFQTLQLLPEARSAFVRFAETVDHALVDLAKNRLQVQSAEKPVGLIKLELPTVVVNSIKIDLEGDKSFQKFLGLCFHHFRGFLENSLADVRKYLRAEFSNSILAMEQQLRADIRRSGQQDATILSDALSRARTEFQSVVEKVAEWFEFSDAADFQRTFTFKEALGISLETVKNTRRGFYPIIEEKYATELPELAAQTLPFVVDVLFIGLDNVWKHSNAGYSPKVGVSFGHENDLLTIEMRNELGADVDRHALLARLAKVKELISQDGKELQLLQTSEGGTGLPKLSRLVLQTERSGKSGKLDFGLKDDWFVLETQLPMLTIERQANQS